MSSPKGKSAAIILLLAAIATAAILASRKQWSDPPPEIPTFETTEAFPQIAEALEKGVAQVRRDPRSGRAWGHLGMLAMAHNYRPQALACFVQAARLVPSQSRWVYYQAIIEEINDLPAAIAHYQAANKLAPRFAPAHAKLARALMRVNQLDDAEKEWTTAAELDPESHVPRLGLGRLAMTRGDLAGWSREAHLELSHVLNRLGETEAAYRQERDAAQIPKAPEGMHDPLLQEVNDLELSGRQLSRQADEAIARGDLKGATELLKQIVQERPDLSQPRLNLGQVLQLQGRADEAISVFQETAEKFPQEALAQFNLGTAREMSGELDAAAASYREALRLKPDYADAFFCLGFLLKKQNDARGAAEVLRQAVSTNPGFVPCRRLLGQTLEELGDRAGALEQYRQAVKLAPNDREAQSQLERLDTMALPLPAKIDSK